MSQEPLVDLAVPHASTVLVTGVNGFIGGDVADQLLQFGCNVRGAVRNTAKHTWLQELFDKKYGDRRFRLVAISDMTQEGAFDTAVRGTAAIVHVASPTSMAADPNRVIPPAVAGALNCLKAANKEENVKRFVLTSSSITVVQPQPDKEGIVLTSNSWNDEAVKKAWEEGSENPNKPVDVYAASKIESEKAIWEFYNDSNLCRSDLVVNTVLPGTNFGRSLDPEHQGHPTTSSFVKSLWNGTHMERLAPIKPQHFVHVEDTARLHLAAVVLSEVQGERIFAWAEPWNFDLLLGILRTQNPDREFVPDFHSRRDLSDITEPKKRAVELLGRLGRVDGFTPIAESIRLNTQDLF